MLRRCMSLSKDTRFTVASLVDCVWAGKEEEGSTGGEEGSGGKRGEGGGKKEKS